MRMLLLIGLFLSFLVLPVRAQALCVETRTTVSKIYDKTVSAFDFIVPVLLQNPLQSIQFHLLRSNELFQQANYASISNAGKAIRLATRGEHHLTLLEKNIRQIQNPKDVPFDQIFAALNDTVQLQSEILAALPTPCAAPITQLQSFEMRTETTMKKLYYESLLP